MRPCEVFRAPHLLTGYFVSENVRFNIIPIAKNETKGDNQTHKVCGLFFHRPQFEMIINHSVWSSN
jgi:hypothetical protein